MGRHGNAKVRNVGFVRPLRSKLLRLEADTQVKAARTIRMYFSGNEDQRQSDEKLTVIDTDQPESSCSVSAR